jgi:hypothetical protein
MEASKPQVLFINKLASRHRVVLLGGMAVIAHGFSRRTKDFDVWLEPFSNPTLWAGAFLDVSDTFPECRIWSLARRCVLQRDQVADEIAEFGVLRVDGFALPVDVFRKPNELDIEDFDRVWASSRQMDDGVWLPDEIDLYQTKAETGRDHDMKDQVFLAGRVKARFRDRLPTCDPADAFAMLQRYADPEVLAFALESPHAEVRDYALIILHEFEAEGDPYSRDILAAWRQRTK